jgi:dienelactone hydrolase
MLHGGTERSTDVVDGRSASWRRMAKLQRDVSPALGEAGVSSWLLRFADRGWNDGAGKVDDARWALEEVRHLVGSVPVVLLGHSMGARTAVHVAGEPSVLGVVALAPWLPRGESVDGLEASVLRAAHGRRDRITSYAATRDYVARAREVDCDASLRSMGWAGHYLLSRMGDWNAFATQETLGLLPRSRWSTPA